MSTREWIYARLTGALISPEDAARNLDEYRDEVRREILGDDLNPSGLVLDAQAYRRLRDSIAATMDDPDRWDRDGDEGSVLEEYVRWLADGKPARDDGWDDAPARTALRGLIAEAIRQSDFREWPLRRSYAAADEVMRVLSNREHAASPLSETERAMLRYALGCAREDMDDRADEFSDDDTAALESLRRLANGPVVAYRNPGRPGVLLCREHGDGWAGLTALHAHDLPDGGTCTYGDPAAGPAHACGRDVLAPQGGGVR